MSPPPASVSPRITSSTDSAEGPERTRAAVTTSVAKSKGSTSIRLPRRAVPIAVRQAEMITASVIEIPQLAQRAPQLGDCVENNLLILLKSRLPQTRGGFQTMALRSGI